MPTSKKKFKDYQEYLNSEKWESVKQEYAEKNNHEYCLVCGSEENLHHHHWRYPKDWNDDTSENIVKICENCHIVAHESENHLNHCSILDFIADLSSYIVSINFDKGNFLGHYETTFFLATEFNFKFAEFDNEIVLFMPKGKSKSVVAHTSLISKEALKSAGDING